MKNRLEEDFQENQFFDKNSSDGDNQYVNDNSIDPLDAYMMNLTTQIEVKRPKEIIMETDDPLDEYLDARKKQFIKTKDCKLLFFNIFIRKPY